MFVCVCMCAVCVLWMCVGMFRECYESVCVCMGLCNVCIVCQGVIVEVCVHP